MRNWLAWYQSQQHHLSRKRNQLTGLANHLPPPLSNQLRCPPSEVVHKTVKGFCWNSPNGIASFTAIYGFLAYDFRKICAARHTGSSSAFIAKRGILIAISESQEDASR